MNSMFDFHNVINALTYASLGVLILLAAYWVIERITPENTWKQVVEQKNVAVAIVMGAFIISVAIIIASAIHG